MSYCNFCSFACFCRALLNIPRCLSRSCLIVFHIFSSSELLSFLASSMYVSIVEYRNCASLPSAIKMLYVEFSSLVVSSFVVDPCEDIAFQGHKKAKKVTHLFSWLDEGGLRMMVEQRKITRPAFESMWLSLQDSFCRFQTTLWFAPVLMSEEEWRPIFRIDRVPASAL
jgi:hypothetical protein